MQITQYGFGTMTVEGRTYGRDLIVYPDRVRPEWWRKDGHSLAVEDLREVLAYEPELLIIGRGFAGCLKVPPETRKAIEARGIRVVEGRTGRAYKVFNAEAGRGRKVVGAFHLTC
jgi:hypothetical protein